MAGLPLGQASPGAEGLNDRGRRGPAFCPPLPASAVPLAGDKYSLNPSRTISDKNGRKKTEKEGQGTGNIRGTPLDAGRGREGAKMGACMTLSVFLTLLFPVCVGLWPFLEGIPLARGGARRR
jgi:hypothetical protein